MQEDIISGTFLINKPIGITSFDCIRHIKKILNIKKLKIGHAGTLDPFASGLLIVCIGRQATKNIDNLLTQDKEYIVKAKLGELTDSMDLTGNIIHQTSISPEITSQRLQATFDSFIGNYEQIPPIYSALKFEGKRLYQLAKDSKIGHEELTKIAESKKRIVTIYSLDLLNFEPPFFEFKAHVSKGTYIRSLANDIAQKLGTTATTYELCRTKVGGYLLGRAINLSQIKSEADLLVCKI